jgi:hypothetical protein
MSDDCCNVPAPATTRTFYPDQIILYGVKLNRVNPYANFFAGQGYDLHVHLYNSQGPLPSNGYSAVLAYGYAFEGHCYRFDKVRTFIITGPVEEDPIGCGFDLEPGANPVYRMWRIRAATELLELTTTLDSAQALVLDANLPGRRSPSTYSITLQMAHRGGRLTRE